MVAVIVIILMLGIMFLNDKLDYMDTKSAWMLMGIIALIICIIYGCTVITY